MLVRQPGRLIGFANGFMVVALKINAFIVTLAMLIIPARHAGRRH
jgi:ribose/xylose/arabinose/galactoside ABC-type transport system permease subunit